ncbi:MAG: hypothetical protein ABUT39_02890 [Acidobacteriota bacterium]
MNDDPKVPGTDETVENTEMTELEEKDLEGVAGGEDPDGNTGCNFICSID